MNKIDDLSPEEILDLLEKIVSDFRFGRHDALAKVLKKLEEKQDKEKLEEVRKELLVQDLYAPLENRDP